MITAMHLMNPTPSRPLHPVGSRAARLSRTLISAVCFACSALAATAATTYYVDYAGGSDQASGTTPGDAFRHAPGDPAAEGNAAATALEPGDTVRFKGGVVYRGRFAVEHSGNEESPIVYDGNRNGTFGDGPAILDGGEQILEWRRCESAVACGGNQHWESIYTATVPAHDGLSTLSAGLVQDGRLLFPAQYPNPENPFYSGNQSRYREAVEQPTHSSLLDPYLKEFGEEHLLGAYAYIRTVQNFVEYLPITGWDDETETLEFQRARRQPTGRYSIVNSLHEKVLDGPGQYVFKREPDAQGHHRVFLWPWDDQDPGDSRISYTARGTAVDFGDGGIRHVAVQGFLIQNYRAGIRGREVGDIVIRDNEITNIRGSGGGSAVSFVEARDLTIADNDVHHCPRSNALQTNRGENIVYSGNTVHMVGRSPLRFYNVRHGQITDNSITDCQGVHSNAITIYVDSRDILVARNRVHRSSHALTLQNTARIYIIGNILTSGGTAVGLWPGETSREYYFLNNFIGTSESAIFVNDPDARDFVFKNNIITGFAGYPLDESHTFSHNIYTAPRLNYHDGEFSVASVGDLVQDIAADNFRPLPAGPTVDMGTDVGGYYPVATFPDFDFEIDFAGKPRSHGDSIDIGPYELPYPPGALDDREAILTGRDALPERPIDAYTRVPDADPIVIPARDFSAEGGGRGRVTEPDDLPDEIAEEDRPHHGLFRNWDSEGHWLEWDVSNAAPGLYKIVLRYATLGSSPRKLSVDGKAASGLNQILLERTPGWSVCREASLPAPVMLEEGSTTLRMTNLGSGGLNLDEIRLIPVRR